MYCLRSGGLQGYKFRRKHSLQGYIVDLNTPTPRPARANSALAEMEHKGRGEGLKQIYAVSRQRPEA